MKWDTTTLLVFPISINTGIPIGIIEFFLVNIYEVRDLFPWEMFTKMVISFLMNVEKIWNSAQINLSSTLNFYQRYVLDATISTEKSTSEIDADLAQNDM